MIDEKKTIKRLEERIDEFIAKHPGEKDSKSVETIREFIHMLKLQALEEEENDNE